MPELPEVHTTVTGLQSVLPGLVITDIWSDMWSTSALAKNTIKDRGYFPYFKKYTLKHKILQVRRRAKHILIDLDNGFTIIIHMKMTGHLMFGNYKLETKKRSPKSPFATWGHWAPLEESSPLGDPYNRHIHVVFSLADAQGSIHHLAFCDSRKFGTIVVEKTATLHLERLSHLGPEPLETSFTLPFFKERLLKSKTRVIKTVLMDQKIIAGIGNIYSDEILWRAGVHPLEKVSSIPSVKMKSMFDAMREVLNKGIHLGGDSMSDYRNILGESGDFQDKHNAYRKTGTPCLKRGCPGTITRIKLGGRSAHFCSTHQKLSKTK